MNHDSMHGRITDELDSIWEAISILEDDAKEHLRQIEDIRRLFQEIRYSNFELTQLNVEDEGEHIAQETDIQVP